MCAERGCPELSDERFCDKHRKDYLRYHESKRESSSSKGYDAQWRKLRLEFLKAYPICQDESGCFDRATDVDHIDGLGPSGPRGHDWSNLRALCHSHHSKRTARDQPGGFSLGTRATGPFTVLIGESGVGKTTIGVRLAGKLGTPRLSRDDFDYGWRDLYRVLDFSEQAVVECVRIPRALRERMEDRGAVLVELTLDDKARRKRLEGREVDPDDIEMLMRVKKGFNAYEVHIEPDMSLDTDQDPGNLVDAIAERVRTVSVGTI